jgi:malonyl-CoA/methylmalonyl-CoA synthetase
LPEEAKYFLHLCDAVLLATVPSKTERARSIEDYVGTKIFVYSPEQPRTTKGLKVDFVLASGATCNPEKGSVLLYTSGTTGPPKGVLHTRRSMYASMKNGVETWRLSNQDVWLHYTPVHWVGGLMFFLMGILSGMCLEFCSTSFNPVWFWERMQSCDVTAIFCSPALLDSLAKTLSQTGHSWTPVQRKAAISGIQKLRILVSGSMSVPPTTQAFWRDLRGGRPLVILWTMTELFGPAISTDWTSRVDVPPVS